MSIREGLKSKPGAGTAAAVLCLLLAAWMIYRELRPEGPVHETQVYYSDDDGLTWFSDSPSLIPPFDHNGKQAVRCFLSKTDGKTSVAYLRKWSPEMADRMKRNLPVGDALIATGLLVKRPGDSKWMPSQDPKAQALISSVSDDDSP